VTFTGISREIIDLHECNMLLIIVTRGGILKLVNMQKLNAPFPMLSMPSWRRMGHLRESKKAESLILLSEVGMMIFFIEFELPRNDSSPISTTPSLSSTSAAIGKYHLL
jgi:hypothetical protein